MKKEIILMMFVTLILSSCNQGIRKLTEGAWLTQVYGSGVNDGDSIFVDAGVTFITFKQDNIFEQSGTVELIGKGTVIYLVNNDNFGLVSNDGRKMPAVIESLNNFKAVGTWTSDDDKVLIKWNVDSTFVNGDLGKIINLNEASASMFMMKYGGIIANRSAECHPQVIESVNNWLEQRSKITFNENKNEWNSIIEGKELPVMWKMKNNE